MDSPSRRLEDQLIDEIVAMTSRNAGSVRTRTVGTALYNMCVQTGNIIANNVRICADHVHSTLKP